MFKRFFKRGETPRVDEANAAGPGEGAPGRSEVPRSPVRVERRRAGSEPTPEELCGIDPNTMSRDTIRYILAALYKRHNQAVSSLNPELRVEAARMLDAIVECRMKYIDSA